MPEAEKTFSVPEPLLMAMLEHLTMRPYSDVYKIIQDIVELVREQNNTPKIQTFYTLPTHEA